MLTTLKATVQGDRIRWLEASEGVFPPGKPVRALITPMADESSATATIEEQSQRRRCALEKLASLNAFSDVEDPVAWQRGARANRDLPGREP